MPSRPITDILRTHTEELMSIPGVVGIGEGMCSGNPCIHIYVVEKTLELVAKLPDSLEGYEVAIIETGEIRPLKEEQ